MRWDVNSYYKTQYIFCSLYSAPLDSTVSALPSLLTLFYSTLLYLLYSTRSTLLYPQLYSMLPTAATLLPSALLYSTLLYLALPCSTLLYFSTYSTLLCS